MCANADVRVNRWRQLLKFSAAETKTKFQMKTLKLRRIQKQSSRGACNKTSHSSKMFFKVGVLKHFSVFTGKNLCWSLFLGPSGEKLY